MNDYRELRINITPCHTDGCDLMAYFLAEAGFESFVPDEKGITAYIREEDFDVSKVNSAIAQYPFAAALEVSSNKIEGRDWNSEWEKNYFQPIVVGDRCVVHSSFHTDVPKAEFDIVIDPKMAFGTGHHATTAQVISCLLNEDLKGKTVIDMGTGTAILAILASILGAKEVTGIEIDDFAYTNALENIALNHVSNNVHAVCGDANALRDVPKADVFIANINRNVITADIPLYVESLNDGATLIFSGFYEEDIPVIMEKARPLGLTETNHTVLDNWACLILKFNRNNA